MTKYQVEVRYFGENYYPGTPSTWEVTCFDVPMKKQVTGYGDSYFDAASNFEKELKLLRSAYWAKVHQEELRKRVAPHLEDWDISV